MARRKPTEWGMPPTKKQLAQLAGKLHEQKAANDFQVMLATLPRWAEEIGCQTEDLVEIIGWMVEHGSPLLECFSLDMHLVDAVVQCRLRREGTYDRGEWVDQDATK